MQTEAWKHQFCQERNLHFYFFQLAPLKGCHNGSPAHPVPNILFCCTNPLHVLLYCICEYSLRSSSFSSPWERRIHHPLSSISQHCLSNFVSKPSFFKFSLISPPKKPKAKKNLKNPLVSPLLHAQPLGLFARHQFDQSHQSNVLNCALGGKLTFTKHE